MLLFWTIDNFIYELHFESFNYNYSCCKIMLIQSVNACTFFTKLLDRFPLLTKSPKRSILFFTLVTISLIRTPSPFWARGIYPLHLPPVMLRSNSPLWLLAYVAVHRHLKSKEKKNGALKVSKRRISRWNRLVKKHKCNKKQCIHKINNQ